MITLLWRSRRQRTAPEIRRRGLYVPTALLRVERALKSWPVPGGPSPLIPPSFVPASKELVSWWYFWRYTAFLIPPLDFILRPIYGTAFTLLVCLTGALLGWFWDSHVRRRLPSGLRFLAWAGHTAQTITNMHAAVESINLYDFIFLVALLALLDAIWDSNWPIDRDSLRALVGPVRWNRVPYMANWGSHVFWFSIRARRSPLLYLVCFPLLLNVGTLVVMTLCQTLDLSDDCQRRKVLGVEANKRNPAACIPPEVQLQIFQDVRASMRFRESERPCSPSAYCDPDARTIPALFKPGLAATRVVCRAWCDAATEVLYVDVRLANGRCTHVLARTLSAHPELALFVRSIVFPDATVRDASVVEQIVRHCVGATRISFFRTETSVYDVPGLTFAAQHVRALVMTGGCHSKGAYTPPDFNMSAVLAIFPNLESLALSRQNILFTHEGLRPETAQVLSRLRALRLDGCSFEFAMLVRLLGALPCLRTIELRNMSSPTGGHLRDTEALFGSQRASLREVLLASTVRGTQTWSLVCLRGVHGLSALRTLAVNARELAQLRALPVALETFVVSFSPYSAWQSRPTCQKSALSAVDAITALAPSAPALSSVRLSDEVHLSQLPAWRVAAFLLREMLAPARVEVEVDL